MNPIRVCDICKEIDDHPRHVFVDATNTYPVDDELLQKVIDADVSAEDKVFLIKQVTDTTERCNHMHCCATQPGGCPEGVCVDNGLRGDELRASIVGE